MTKQKANNLDRRKLLKKLGACAGVGAAASLTVWHAPLSAAIGAQNKATTTVTGNKKVVWLVLRGALDSIHTLVPSFETSLKSLRPNLSQAYNHNLLALDRGFALHPALKNLHQWYQQKQLLPIVAVGSGYGARSHFDGQDFLESGKPQIDFDSGWLARAIDQKNKKALAIARAIPVSLRSSSQVDTWYPSKLKNGDDALLESLMSLYQNDDELLENLQDGLNIRNMAMGKEDKKTKKSRFTDLAQACGQLLSGQKQGEQGQVQEIDCAMLELGGWDTHYNQVKRLDRALAELDQGLAVLKASLAEQWQNTVVIVATEFGRTVKENGTGGTDHGTGSAMFLAGGAVNGGRVLGEWPGLATHQQFEQRDLKPTSNSFSWLASLLAQHWQLSDLELSKVFPTIKAQKTSLLRA